MSPGKAFAALIHLPLIDSTNNYAMQLLDAEAAVAGTTIVADAQSAGKGQRGNTWRDTPGESLLMSTVLAPGVALEHQFALSAAVAVVVAKVLMEAYAHWEVRIKWPNDIIINDRKAGGILIENVLRGARWCWCVVGVGVNVGQKIFPPELPFATSLLRESGKDFVVLDLAEKIAGRLTGLTKNDVEEAGFLSRYNDYLFKKDAPQNFSDGVREWTAVVREVTRNGQLRMELEDGEVQRYTHGSVQWVWR